MLVEKEINELYYIALIHDSLRTDISYVEARVADNDIIEGVDKGRKDISKCLLFANPTNANLFARMWVTAGGEISIEKITKDSFYMNQIEQKGLKEYKFATFKGGKVIRRSEEAKCYLMRD